MEFVIDANAVFSALICLPGMTTELIFSGDLMLSAPGYLEQEVKKHKEEILKKSGMTKEDLELALSLIFARIKLVPLEEFSEFISEASKISPDCDDTEYFALALKKKCPLWSNDKLLKKQGSVKVLSTKEVLDLLGRK